MKMYHKIKSVLAYADVQPYKKRRIYNELKFVDNVCEFFKFNNFHCTEKVDGTNIIVFWNGRDVTFKGRKLTDQIPAKLLEILKNTFTKELMKIVFGTRDNSGIVIYVEGHGYSLGSELKNKMPLWEDLHIIDIGGINLTTSEISFFDFERLEMISSIFKLNTVPLIGIHNMCEAVEMCKNTYMSTINENIKAEGIVIRPVIDLKTKTNERIIYKIRSECFECNVLKDMGKNNG